MKMLWTKKELQLEKLKGDHYEEINNKKKFNEVTLSTELRYLNMSLWRNKVTIRKYEVVLMKK